MKNNAIKFNGVGSVLGNEAIAIYEFVKDTVAGNREDFNRMEDAVREQLNNGRKRPKTSKGSKKKKEENKLTNETSTNTANVVLDGVETTVNIGDMNFDFDGVGDTDSDDSALGKLAL